MNRTARVRDGLWAVALLAVYLCATLLRLAYFNQTGLSGEGGAQYYTGLPATYAVLLLPAGFVLSFFLSASAMRGVLAGLYAFLSLAMVSSVRVRKTHGVWYGVFLLAALAMTGVYVRALVGR